MFDFREEIKAALEVMRGAVDVPASVAIITGSGLEGLIDRGLVESSLRFGSVPGMPIPKVPGHTGTLGIAQIGGERFLYFRGRSHLYEGHPVQRLGVSVRIAAAAGVRTLVTTCAAGSLNPGLPAGSLVIITDHINFSGENPLVGILPTAASERFPDTSRLYTEELREAAEKEARRLGVKSGTGVYAWVKGPSYETPAETRMLARLGADVVGMSLVPETLTAAQLGLRVLAIAAVTNAVHGHEEHVLKHSEILKRGEELVEPLSQILHSLAPLLVE